MAERESRNWPGIDVLPHPGYHQHGTTSPLFVSRLAKYRVALCTSSIYRFALRKIFEATAAGCRVVTNLPGYDDIPWIDDNLTRVPNGISASELEGVIRNLASTWDLDQQKHYSQCARDAYNWHNETDRVANELRRFHEMRMGGVCDGNVFC
jgi:hypothetical protein